MIFVKDNLMIFSIIHTENNDIEIFTVQLIYYTVTVSHKPNNIPFKFTKPISFKKPKNEKWN